METITLEQLQELFTGLRAETTWDVNGEMLWGYFFTAKSAEPLESAASALAQSGYSVVGIFQNEDEPDFILHVERVEKHTPETLFSRNQQLEALATEFELEAYDGMDVNPVPTAEELAAAEAGEEDEEFDDDEDAGAFDGLDESVENPELVAAIEALEKDDSEEAQETLTEELQRAIYLVPVLSDPEDTISTDEGDAIQLIVCTDEEGAEFMPLFTDKDALQEWTEDPASAIALTASEAWEFVLSQPECAGAVINPGGLALPLDRALVEILKEHSEETEEEEEE